MSHPLTAYLPRWLLARLAQERSLLGQTYPLEAAILFADIAGFTRLTEAMAQRGPQGVEVLSQVVNVIFDTLVETVYAFGGDVTGFAGDAITAFWPLADDDGTEALRAVAAAQAIQAVMSRFSEVATPSGPMGLAMRIGIGCGTATLLVVGDPQQQRSVLTGDAVLRALEAERQVPRGHVLLHESLRHRLGSAVECDGAGSLTHLQAHVPSSPPPPLPAVDPARLRPFVHPALQERMEAGQGEFMADFRHGVVPMFVSFDADTPDAIQATVAQALPLIEQHGGYLAGVDVADKGPVLTVLFGAPLAAGDHPVRAAACALDLAGLSATRAIGATTGTVFAGTVGSARRRQYTVFGDEVNLSARLMEQARASGDRPAILLSLGLRRQVGDRFVCSEPQPVPVRGKVEPVSVTCLLRWLPGRGNRFAAWPPGDDLVGRRNELARLDEAIARTLSGETVLLTIVGDAGIGKSRLVGELLRRWLPHSNGACLGAALASAQHSPYFAWGELMRDFFDLPGDEVDVERIEAALAAVHPDLALRLPLLSDVLGLGLPDNDLTRGFDAHLRQQSTQALLIDLLRDRAARQPLLLVLEDGHWLDQLSWELALAVARASRHRPILLCIAHRSLGQPLPEACNALIGLEQHTTIELGEMSPEEVEALARARLGVADLPVELSSLLHEKAQGHPFFVEEILKALQDDGVIGRADGHLVVRGDLRRLNLPDTVQGVVQARMDRLDEQTRLTLKVASVIGRTFDYQTLHDVHPLGLPDPVLRAHLDTLEQLDITPLERHDPQPTYGFKHAITQEVTYQTLLFAQRRRLHEAVAGWIERTYANRPAGLNPHYSLLAYHYGHAQQQAKQVYYLERLAQQAHARYALDVAGAAYEQLTALLDEWQRDSADLQADRVKQMQALDPAWGRQEPILTHLFDALLRYEDLLNLAAQRAEQDAITERLERLAREADSLHWLAVARVRRARYLFGTGASAEATAAARDSLDAARRCDDRQAQTNSLLILSSVSWSRSDYDDAHRFVSEALALARAADDRRGVAEALSRLGVIHSARNDYQGLLSCHREALDIYRALGDLGGEAISLLNLGVASIMGRNLERSLQFFHEALVLTRRIGARRLEGAAMQILAEGYREVGQYDQALVYAQRGLALLESVGDRLRVLHALHTMADACHGLGDTEHALAALRQVMEQAQAIGARFIHGFALHTMGNVYLNLGDADGAERFFDEAAALRLEIEAPGDGAASLARSALAALALGELEAAIRRSEEAVALMEQVGNAGEYPPQEVWWARYRALEAVGEQEAARRALAQARRLVGEQAGRLNDPDLRRSFLENIAVNRQIVAATASADAPPAPRS